MKSSIILTSLFALIVPCVAAVAPQSGETYTGAPFQERKAGEAAAGDRVYTVKEVDVKARITNKTEHLPQPGKDCPGRGTVKLGMILHKSGEVREVTIIEGLGCSYDEAAVEAARKLRFNPAVKGGQQVSQYQIFMYSYQLSCACTGIVVVSRWPQSNNGMQRTRV